MAMNLCVLAPNQTPYFKGIDRDAKLELWLTGNSFIVPVTANYILTGNELNYTLLTSNNPTIVLPSTINAGYGVYIKANSGYFNLTVGDCLVSGKVGVGSLTSGWYEAWLQHLGNGVWEVYGNTYGVGATVTEDLLAYYSFNTSLTQDDSGNGYELVLINSPTSIVGKQDNAIEMDSASSQGATSSLYLPSGFTMAFWAKYVTGGSTVQNGIFNVPSPTDWPWMQGFSADGGSGLTYRIVLDLAAGGSGNATLDVPVFSPDEWVFISYVFWPLTQTFDGRSNLNAGTPSFSVNWDWNDAAVFPEPVHLGYNISVYYDCNFDEIGFWNRPLSDAELSYLYNSGAGRTYQNGIII